MAKSGSTVARKHNGNSQKSECVMNLINKNLFFEEGGGYAVSIFKKSFKRGYHIKKNFQFNSSIFQKKHLKTKEWSVRRYDISS